MSATAGVLVLVLFGLVFGVAVPFLKALMGTRYIESGPRNVRYIHDPQEDWGSPGQIIYRDRRDHWRPSARSGCATVGVIAFIAAILFVAIVIRWSVMVEAGF